MANAWVYILTNKPNGTLYTGVTKNLPRRIREHREGLVDGFTKTYALKRLVYTEPYESIVTAFQREKTLKHWSRAWKVNLILKDNPDWDDLYNLLS